ncbi:MAG: aminotransferase class III-fold pyridoxal phosphate-dependent enzyme [Ilumatobacteraceae bacterium]
MIDETHTICVGPGGATRAWGLEPDFFVIGKTIGGGMPVAAYGMTAEIADRLSVPVKQDTIDTSGVGGTLTGNALALAAVRATLSSALRDDDFAHMVPLATAWTDGVRSAYTSAGLPWHVQQLGARAEYWFCPPPRHRADAVRGIDADLDRFMHLGDEPRHPAHAVPQHGAVLAAPPAGRRRPPHRGVRRRRRRATGTGSAP